MAIQEQLSKLMQGAEAWNEWRKTIPDPFFSPDLTNAYFNRGELELAGANLYRANLNGAHFMGMNLTGTILTSASLVNADLYNATLNNAKLNGSYLLRANLHGTKLIGADLRRASLPGTILADADLTDADLQAAQLMGTNFTDVKLDNANFNLAEFGDTVLANINLAVTAGLENTRHRYFSAISSSTMQLSEGKIPVAFLRGCGFTDWEIESVKLYQPNLSNDEINSILYEIYNLRAQQPLQISPLFISYSHADCKFVDKLTQCFSQNGIRFWIDSHNAIAGRLETQIDRAMRLNPTVLLILSEHALKSDWVEHEVRSARQLEKELGHDILCPVALDEKWKASNWSKRLMEQITEYNILDFSGWKNEGKFMETFKKLIAGLDLFYE